MSKEQKTNAAEEAKPKGKWDTYAEGSARISNNNEVDCISLKNYKELIKSHGIFAVFTYFICGEKQIFADVSVWYEWVVNKGNFRDPCTNELLRECDIARLKNQYRLLKRYGKMTEENRSEIVKLILEKPRSELTEVDSKIHQEFELPRLSLRTILFDLAKVREIMQYCNILSRGEVPANRGDWFMRYSSIFIGICTHGCIDLSKGKTNHSKDCKMKQSQKRVDTFCISCPDGSTWLIIHVHGIGYFNIAASRGDTFTLDHVLEKGTFMAASLTGVFEYAGIDPNLVIWNKDLL